MTRGLTANWAATFPASYLAAPHFDPPPPPPAQQPAEDKSCDFGDLICYAEAVGSAALDVLTSVADELSPIAKAVFSIPVLGPLLATAIAGAGYAALAPFIGPQLASAGFALPAAIAGNRNLADAWSKQVLFRIKATGVFLAQGPQGVLLLTASDGASGVIPPPPQGGRVDGDAYLNAPPPSPPSQADVDSFFTGFNAVANDPSLVASVRAALAAKDSSLLNGLSMAAGVPTVTAVLGSGSLIPSDSILSPLTGWLEL